MVAMSCENKQHLVHLFYYFLEVAAPLCTDWDYIKQRLEVTSVSLLQTHLLYSTAALNNLLRDGKAESDGWLGRDCVWLHAISLVSIVFISTGEKWQGNEVTWRRRQWGIEREMNAARHLGTCRKHVCAPQEVTTHPSWDLFSCSSQLCSGCEWLAFKCCLALYESACAWNDECDTQCKE